MAKDKYTRVLTVTFDGELSPWEVPYFRGAVIATMGDKSNLLFHNHDGDEKLRYSYPLIQYKRIGGKAAIVCVNEGADMIGQFLSEGKTSFNIGNRTGEFNLEKVSPNRALIQTWDKRFQYRISKWLALNSVNYRRYLDADGIVEKTELLQGILTGNLLSMCKGLDIFLEKQIEVKITKLSEPYTVRNKGVKLVSFNAEFTCNMFLPNYIGIGKNASIGYGVITEKKDCRKKDNEDNDTDNDG
ncbi:MAG: hypothetical protein KBT29_05555 [Prevotellaceae bacterium]|nr:hypothetical protein [Candidatus Minthosoma caballi]